jgi:hypothetical protein
MARPAGAAMGSDGGTGAYSASHMADEYARAYQRIV